MPLNDATNNSSAMLVSETLGSRAAEQIRAAIVHGTIAAGSVLRLDDLAKQFGISRIPLRDALRQLEKEGFMTVTPYKGARVNPVSTAELREMSHMSMMLNCLGLEHAFPNLTPESLDRADELYRVRNATTDVTEWRRLNIEFLNTLYGPANRPFLLSLMQYINDQSLRYLHMYLQVRAALGPPTVTFHEVIAACRRRDLDAAIKAIEENYRSSVGALLAHLEHTSNGDIPDQVAG